MKKVINIALDFCKTPGGRYKSDGPYSGEHFREILVSNIENPEVSKIEVVFDGLETSGSSFLEEAFGGLIREGYSLGFINSKIDFVCKDDLAVVLTVKKYLEDAENAK